MSLQGPPRHTWKIKCQKPVVQGCQAPLLIYQFIPARPCPTKPKKKSIILLMHFSPKHHKSDFWPLNLIHLHLRCHRGYSWDWKTLYKFNSIKVIWKHQPWLATEKKYAAVIRVLCTFFPADILSVSLVGNYSGSECCRCFYDLKLKI